MKVEYSEIRNNLKTGDIVLFSGRDFVSKLIQFGTRSKWSHVGMIYRIYQLDFVTLWESTTLSDCVDLDSGTKRKGVQLTALSDRVRYYDGEIAIRQLENPVTLANDRLLELRQKLKSKRYETSEAELIKSAFDFAGLNNKPDLSSVFCSELVAEAYKKLGLLTDRLSSNEYTPSDFANISTLSNANKLTEIKLIKSR